MSSGEVITRTAIYRPLLPGQFGDVVALNQSLVAGPKLNVPEPWLYCSGVRWERQWDGAGFSTRFWFEFHFPDTVSHWSVPAGVDVLDTYSPVELPDHLVFEN